MTSRTILHKRAEARPGTDGFKADDLRRRANPRSRKTHGKTLTTPQEGNEETPTIMPTYPQAANVNMTGMAALLESQGALTTPADGRRRARRFPA